MAVLTGRSVRAARIAAGIALAMTGCADGGRDRADAASRSVAALASLPWDSVVARARGTTVIWRMWRGDPGVNAYVDDWLTPRLREQYGIRLEAVEGQGAEIVNALVTERDAGTGRGAASLLWINGETFGQLRSENLLAGPWAGRLPASRCVDSASTYIARDFEQDPAGFESPWGTVAFAFIYDSARTPRPPRSVAELAAWIRAHPGRFTHGQGFTGMTFLKTVMYAVSGGPSAFRGGFDSARYEAGRDRLFAWLDQVVPAFWRGGATYPPDVAALHRLFANREVDFSMSNNQNEVLAKIRQGVLPQTSRALVLRDGTIANTHFVGIPFNAPNAAGAMVVANFLLTPEAQFEKQRPATWGDGTVCALDRLPPEWRARFARLVEDSLAIPASTVRQFARPEVAPTYHARLLSDWRLRFRDRAP